MFHGVNLNIAPDSKCVHSKTQWDAIHLQSRSTRFTLLSISSIKTLGKKKDLCTIQNGSLALNFATGFDYI